MNPGTVRVSTENSKDEVILGRCAIYRPATAVFIFKEETNINGDLKNESQKTQAERLKLQNTD